MTTLYDELRDVKGETNLDTNPDDPVKMMYKAIMDSRSIGNSLLRRVIHHETDFLRETYSVINRDTGALTYDYKEYVQCLGDAAVDCATQRRVISFGVPFSITGCLLSACYGWYAGMDEEDINSARTRREFMKAFGFVGAIVVGSFGSALGYASAKRTERDYVGRARDLDELIGKIYKSGKN